MDILDLPDSDNKHSFIYRGTGGDEFVENFELRCADKDLFEYLFRDIKKSYLEFIKHSSVISSYKQKNNVR